MGREAESLCSTGGPPRWKSSWQSALLAASILSSCLLLTGVQSQKSSLVVTVEPPQPVVGGVVTLTPQGGTTENLILWSWYRGGTDLNSQIFTYYPNAKPDHTPGANYTGRETSGEGCFLHITNLALNDSGTYIVVKSGPGFSEIGSATIVVSEVLSKPNVSVSPSPYRVEFFDSLGLTCETPSELANVSWFLNGEPLQNSSRIELSDNNRTLAIQSILRSDAGEYQCEVHNLAFNETSDNKHIFVFYGPDKPEIQPNKTVYGAHSDIQLSCKADSTPPAEYKWLFNEKELKNGSVLSILDASREHSGNYTCQASNLFDIRSDSTTLEVKVVGGVYDVTINGPSLGTENQPVTLNCTAVGPNITYYWANGGVHVKTGGNIHLEDDNKILKFEPSTRNNTGSYTCHAFNNISSNASKPHWLEIFYGPDRPIINPLETIYTKGSSLNLSCSASSIPPANYSWSHNGEPLKQENSSQLWIKELFVENSGSYTCNATNDYTDLSNVTNLVISILEVVTDITITGSPNKPLERNITVLKCTAIGTNISYYWLKDNQTLNMTGHIFLSDNNQTLTFNKTIRSDSGKYTCCGYNRVSTANTTYLLDVFYGPDAPVISPKGQQYAEGDRLNLSCEAGSNPPAQFTWLFNNTLVKNGSQLLVLSLSLNDTGSYTCEAFNNETGSSSNASWEIWVLQKLSDPVLWTPEPMVPENANVTLHCNTSNNPGVGVSWFKNDKLLQPVTGLSEQNRTLTLVGVTKSDSGIYTCEAENPVSSAKSNPRNITVAYGPSVKLNPEGAVTKQIGSTLTLECSAVSVPSAQFRWLFNNTGLNVTGSVFTAPLTEWKDQGNYTCQAENSFTNNTASASAYVTLTASPPSAPPLSGGAIAGIVIGCIAGVALIGGLLYFLFTKTSLGRMELHASNGNIPSAPGCNQGVTDTKPTSGEEDIQYSTLAFNTNNPPQPAPEVSRSLDSSTIYSVIKKK